MRLAQMAEVFGTPLSKTKVELYVQILGRMKDEDFNKACIRLLETHKFNRFPLPAEFLESSQDKERLEMQAQQIPFLISGAVSKYGIYNPKDAADELGPVAWDVVRKLGGWQHLCANLGVSIQLTSFIAQVRDLAESTLELDRKGLLNKQIDYNSGQSRIGSLTRIGDGDGRKSTTEEIIALVSKGEE